jgi:hypothetical protein
VLTVEAALKHRGAEVLRGVLRALVISVAAAGARSLALNIYVYMLS